MDPRFSFVIPALNEAHYVADTLNSIHRATVGYDEQPAYEIIVVDDCSTERTAAIARRHGARVIQLRKRNIAAVRNAGASVARGELLVFVDADTQVSEAVIRETTSAMKTGCTWGTALATPSDKCPLWSRPGLAAFNLYYVRWRQCAYGFFFFINRQVFRQVHGFPEDTCEGEDMALSKRLAARYGRPTVLRSRVATSARKAWQFGFRYHLKMLWLALRYGDGMYTRPEIADYRDGELRVYRPQ
jgi:glycosyltransferase involved in cell wall biosynthesis